MQQLVIQNLEKLCSINFSKLLFDKEKVSPTFLLHLEHAASNAKRKQIIIGIALTILGISGLSTSHLYNPLNSTQSMQQHGSQSLTQPNQDAEFNLFYSSTEDQFKQFNFSSLTAEQIQKLPYTALSNGTSFFRST